MRPRTEILTTAGVVSLTIGASVGIWLAAEFEVSAVATMLDHARRLTARTMRRVVERMDEVMVHISTSAAADCRPSVRVLARLFSSKEPAFEGPNPRNLAT